MITARIFSVILLLLTLSSCTSRFQEAEDGAVTLALDQVNIVQGEWDFYWGQLLSPTQLELDTSLKPSTVTVPSSWHTYVDSSGKTYPFFGSATYHITIRTTKPTQQAAMLIPKIWCAAKVYINGELSYQAGQVSLTEEGYRNVMLEHVVPLPNGVETIDLVVQVSNHSLAFTSGLLEPFRLGPAYLIEGNFSTSSTWQVLMLGGLVFIGIYHFFLYYFRPEDKSTLYFGLFCFLIALLLIVFGEHELYRDLKGHWGVLSFPIQFRLYYLSIFASI